jgi:acetoacetate decarboxylase
MFVYIGRLNIETTPLYSYLELGIGVPVFYSETQGNYAVYLYLDKIPPIVGGREIWGWPKKEADITFLEEQNKISAKVVRDGNTLVNISLNLTEQVDPIPSQPSLPWINLKLIPSVKKGVPPDVKQLTSALVNSETKEMHAGKATLEFGSTPLDPLGKIKIVEIMSGVFTISDFVLDYGEVLYDYLNINRKSSQ